MSDLSSRPTRALIDLDALAHNFHAMRGFVGEDLRYMAVVKASAYGHGSIECAKRLADEGVDWFGVAIPEEGSTLREAGIPHPILCLGSFAPGQERFIIDDRLTPVLFDLDSAHALSQRVGDGQQDVHIKIDTGMGRLGVRWTEVSEFAQGLSELANIHVTGMMTHFASADDPEQFDFTEQQIDRFNDAIRQFRANGFNLELVGIANSPGAICHPNSRVDLIRLGGSLFSDLCSLLSRGSRMLRPFPPPRASGTVKPFAQHVIP
jgi:alanine racemase